MEKNGKVNVVAKTGGFKLEGEDAWFNPVESLKANITPDLKGRNVKLTINEKGKVTAVDVSEEPLKSTLASTSMKNTKVTIGAEPTIKYQKVKVEMEFIIEYSTETEFLNKVKECQKKVNALAIEQLKEIVEKVATVIGESI